MLRNHDTANELKALGSWHSEAIPETPYKAPTGYFDHLPQRVLQRIHSEEARDELSAISPLLASAGKETAYRIAENYFEALNPYRIPKHRSTILRWLPEKRAIRYAVAASIVTAIGTLMFFLARPQQKMPDYVAAGLKIKTEAAFNQELAQLSDEAIYGYLLSTADLTDTEVISGWIDQGMLPAETDYMDPGFTEDYLQQIENNLYTAQTIN